MLASVSTISRPRKWPLLRFSRAVASAAASPTATSISHSFEEIQTKSPSHATSRPLVVSNSLAFLNGLAKTHFVSTHRPQPTEADLVKREISNLLKNKSYDSLARVLVKWTSVGSDATWQSVLTHDELSYLINKIVNHQIGLITKAGTSIMVHHNGIQSTATMTPARDLREKVRSIYNNLLFGELRGHLYSRNRRNAVGNFPLSGVDYENLITLEVNNGKLDLASKWFHRMELQYADGLHYKHMTQKLWFLKFQVYSGGLPSLWKVEPTDLYEVEVNPRRSRFKAEKKWLEVFDDFVSHQQLLLASSKVIFDTSLLTVMLSSMAYSHNVAQVTKLVEQNWGITSGGKMAANFAKPVLGDPLFPTLELVQTIVVSMIFNKQYIASLAYLNAFQEHYSIDLSESKHCWDQLFRWSEITTRFSEFRTLQYFIKQTATTLYKPVNDGEVAITLEEAQRSADFDYEGYLKFVADLTNQRTKLIGELWKCYHQSQPGFSARVYLTYLRLLEENPLDETAYEYLSALALEHRLHDISGDSFNKSATNDTMHKIRTLYNKGMKTLINEKGMNGELWQVEPLIRKWSLDATMRERLSVWSTNQQPRFLEAINKRKLTISGEDEEEGFLGLMS